VEQCGLDSTGSRQDRARFL